MPLNWKEEEKTVEAADVEDFQTLYRDNLDLIYYYVLSKVANRQEAEDLTSQVFLKVVRGLDLKRDPRSLRTWLFPVARTTLADYWRISLSRDSELPGRVTRSRVGRAGRRRGCSHEE